MKKIKYIVKLIKWYILAFPLIYKIWKSKQSMKKGKFKKYTLEEFIEELNKKS